MKQVVAERDAARRAVENKEKAKMKYAQTIKDIEKITGAPVCYNLIYLMIEII